MSYLYDDQTKESDTSKLNAQAENVLLCLVLSSFLVNSIFLPKIAGYLLVAGVFGACLLWLVLTGEITFMIPKSIMLSYLSILSLFIFGAGLNPSIRGVARLGAFVSVTSVILFLLILTVDFEIFWRLYGIVTAGIVVVGTPTLFVDQISLGSVVISSYTTTPTSPINIGINTIQSIFINPNNLALVCGFAVVGLVTTQKWSKFIIIVVAINAVGVFVSDGQAAQLATIAGIGIFSVGQFNRSLVPLVTTAALTTIIGGMLILFKLLPGPEMISTISLSGRRHLWRASVHALEMRPWVGYGPVNMGTVLEPYISDPRRLGAGPHNSYIRIALTSGIFGLLSYLILHLYALFQSAKPSDCNTLASHAVLWSAIIFQLFNGKTIFGISPSSILFAVALGWSLRELSLTDI
ncbi:O-antigen ligase family protein [Halorubrum ezzemoulense]|uniref:O-antigen ligase family protein n=1 Tax=Halorubrum ezzemoulense TaxID=337243 RepID=UPI00232D8FAD|nr:O-antigen ligase family protein [Halorubrum ezzemoulense]MDB2248609.1 hypothetical protein [Halorubrum ezzemoulense]